MRNATHRLEQRRYSRYIVQKAAKIICSNKRELVDVRMIELSVGGARISLASPRDFVEITSLLITSEKMLYPVVARWYNEELMGIQFEGEPMPWTLADINR